MHTSYQQFLSQSVSNQFVTRNSSVTTLLALLEEQKQFDSPLASYDDFVLEFAEAVAKRIIWHAQFICDHLWSTTESEWNFRD